MTSTTLVPSGDGTSTSHEFVGGPPEYSRVNDSNDATYISTDEDLTLTYNRFTKGTLGIGTDNIQTLTVYGKIRKVVGGPTACNPGGAMGLYIGTTDYFPASSTISSTLWSTISYATTVNPATSGSWTEAAIDALEIMVKGQSCRQRVSGVYYYNMVDVSEVWMVVDYTTGGGGSMHYLTCSETIDCVDSRTGYKYLSRAYNEILGLVDSYSRTKKIVRNFTESLGLVDSFSRLKRIFRTFTESLGAVDSILIEAITIGPKTVYVTVTEILGALDSYARSKAIHRNFTEILGLSDTVDKVKEVIAPVVEAITRTARKLRRKQSKLSIKINGFLDRKVTSSTDVYGTAIVPVLAKLDIDGTLIVSIRSSFRAIGNKRNLRKILYLLLGI